PSARFESPPQTPEGTTNPELLKSKEMASVMYCLDALERFEKLDMPTIQQITFEIAMIGRNGIDYSDPDQRYHLTSIPDEEFTGLRLLALMYVGFQKIDPTIDVSIDLKDAYQTALALHQGQL